MDRTLYNPMNQKLFERIAKCMPRAIGLDAPVFRSTTVKYGNEKDFISGVGAGYHGGRWNPKGIRAVYGSLTPVTAVEESYQQFYTYGFKAANIKPRVLAGIRVKVHRLLDLTDAKIRRKIGFTLTDLICEDWHAIQGAGEESWTQTIGRGTRAAGFEGLLAPSAQRRSGKNAVIFPDKLDSNSSLALIAGEELPPHPSEWPK